MDGMIYLASSSGANILQAQAISANNLANVNTAGFKADHPQFASVLRNSANTLASRVYSTIDDTRTDFSAGELMPTGRNLDISINGEGWLAVMGKDGNEAYIRTSSMEITQEGLLVTSNQFPIMGASGPITLPAGQKIEIGTDGTITATPVEGNNKTPTIIDRIKLVKPENDQLIKMADGLVRPKTEGALEPDSSVKLTSGYLESSNVNVIESMMSMIALSRQFEMQLKLLTIAKENAQATDRTLALS